MIYRIAILNDFAKFRRKKFFPENFGEPFKINFVRLLLLLGKISKRPDDSSINIWFKIVRALMTLNLITIRR